MTDLVNIKAEVRRQEGWSADYTDRVAAYYEAFMALRDTSEDYSPPDNVDKFWHIHILNTEHYAQYCTARFGRVVPHRTSDAADRAARARRLARTISALGEAPVARVTTSAAGRAITVMPSLSTPEGETVLYNSLSERNHMAPLPGPTNIWLHFSRSPNGSNLTEAIPYQGIGLSVRAGYPLSKVITLWAKEKIHEDLHIAITRRGSEYHAYLHAMGSHGYC